MKNVIVAGGCFWGVEAYYARLKGVISTEVGYIDGDSENPSYQEVCQGSNHAEAVKIQFDEHLISFSQILNHFLRIVDPTQVDRQGPDIGRQYRSAIYCYSEADKEQAILYFQKRQPDYSRPIRTEVKNIMPFYSAETDHQKYLFKNPNGYCHISLNKAKKEELKEEYHD
ncbi:MAG: peptide-methionine (S)-S-oxide reductase MsrA [Candidatus Izemoplasmatales bacterium]|jgi:peptide-methionine (S)-S-oxide reductase|nr:peptide-methionine (S)-S-oxide reductase MsrA [Candidatus Izemoplasmatales bacterium]MDD4354765.1 peptide-methionine (S)-S-oxide reductase MsrA [Candidatus Izemoplasmatales bacterium]MDD4987961.1 peptide-methionine (S)-S-oxide reductase MsrA [Candidatus Izemoplasmatales bacterium]MDY0373944.1 peptide-methionine (S)-S-oxide reductase MsrA [Candidatus Izemoplasmatales bacterium]NLF48211.1 peptide-methionine (S)-S-oxide reductase MsrA [Acholeplasmataceae bacterium]